MSETIVLAGTASALAWRLKRPDVALYNTIGELKYDLAYPDSVKQRVDPDKVQTVDARSPPEWRAARNRTTAQGWQTL